MDTARLQELRQKPVSEGKNLIDGLHCDAEGNARLDVTSPIDGSFLATIPNSSRGDADRAVSAARRAFDDGRWSGLAPSARKKILMAWADLIEANAEELAVLGVRDNGTEIAMAMKAEPMTAAATIRYYAEAADKLLGEIAPTPPGTLGLVHREPVGVVGAIVPWNFPLMIGTWKLGPALAVGCSVVLKPAETASLSLLRIADLALEAGVPPGVLNVVTGDGSVVGDAIAHSMDVDVLVFTGSGATGRKLLEAAARSNLKRVYLELGGKSPNVIFADAPDLDEAAKVSAGGIFRNAGQVCVAGSRLLVERGILDAFTEKLKNQASSMVVGDPLDPATQSGALNSEAHLARVQSFLNEARSLPHATVQGGDRILEETGGTYMSPAIVSGANPDDRIVREEVFGPVVTIQPFDTEDQALALANDTDYGLAAAVWTSNLARAHRMIKGIRAGVVHVNTYGGVDVTVPMGGVKQSGNGHDKSLHAFDKYLDLKTAWIKI